MFGMCVYIWSRLLACSDVTPAEAAGQQFVYNQRSFITEGQESSLHPAGE